MSHCLFNRHHHHVVIFDTQVEQLHLRLQQEKSMRLVLEKAMGRGSSSLSPRHRHFSSQVTLVFTIQPTLNIFL